MRERRLPDDTFENYAEMQRQCSNPGACEAYFKFRPVKGGTPEILPGTYCTCEPPSESTPRPRLLQ